jgi:hypothetical protein
MWAFGAAIVAASAFNVSAAVVLVSDTFPYPAGNLAGNTPATGGVWTAYSSAGSHPIQVTSNAIVVDDNVGAEDDKSSFGDGLTDAAGDVLTSSYSVNVSAPTVAFTPEYFGIFLEATSDFDSRIWVAAPATPGDGYRIALSQGSSSTATGVVYSPDLAYGTTHTVTSTYDFSNKNGTLTVDGNVMGTTSDSGFSDGVTAYAFRQSSVAGDFTVTVSNLQVTGDLVPEPASLGLLFGASGLVLGRRSRRRV